MSPAEHFEWTEFHERLVREFGIDGADRIVRLAMRIAYREPMEIAMAMAVNWWDAKQYQLEY